MTKEEFKNAFSYYRKQEKQTRGTNDGYIHEFVEFLNPLRDLGTNNDVLVCRTLGFNFSSPKNRNGQYGWESYGYKLGNKLQLC